jgi:hypothetical protein
VLAVLEQCGGPAVENIALSILSRVMGALSSNDYSSLLDSIVSDLKSKGISDAEGIVTCAVKYADASLNPPPMARELQNSTNTAIKEHARAYLSRNLKKPSVDGGTKK